MATENTSGGGWGWGLAGALVGAVGVGLLMGASGDELRRELAQEHDRLIELHRVYFEEKRTPSDDEAARIWAPYRNGPYWMRLFPDGGQAAYTETGRLVSYTAPRKRGRR